MKFRIIAFYAFVILFFTSLALALYTASFIGHTDITTAEGGEIQFTDRQINRWVAHQSPYFFGFEARTTSMSAYYPFTQDYGTLLKVNSQGFRTSEYTTARPPNTFRVAVLGDQVTSGSGVTIEETYTHLASRFMNDTCADVKVEMINLGTAGHRFADNVIKLFVHAEALNPDLVIFQVRLSDIDFYKYVAIYEIQGLRDVHVVYGNKRKQIFDPSSVDWRVFAQGVREVAAWSKRRAVPVLFLVLPPINTMKTNDSGSYSPELIRTPEFLWTENIVREIKGAGVPTLYLLQTFRENVGNQYLGISEASPDLNAYAHYVIGRALASHIKDSGLFVCGPARPADPQWSEEKNLRQDAADNWLKYNHSFVAQLGLYENLKRLHPNNLWITGQLADAYFLRDRYLDALHQYESMAVLAPKYAAPWCQIAFCIGRGSGANEFLQKAIQVDPDQTLAMDFLSDYYLKSEQIPEACRLLQRLMEIPGYTEQYEKSKKLFSSKGCQNLLASAGSQTASAF